MFPPLPLLSPRDLDTLQSMMVDWALCHGLTIRALSPEGEISRCSGVHVPLSLLPTPFPRALFQKACELQPSFNFLIHKVSRNHEFLCSVIDSLGESDSFTLNLFSIYSKLAQNNQLKQDISLGIYRSDYLMHLGENESCSLRQVELNTIASSFACLSSLTTQLHQYISQCPILAESYSSQNLPSNPSIELIAHSFKVAYELYGRQEAIIVIVVQHNERNAFDQRHLEHKLFAQYKLKVVRMTLLEIHKNCYLENNRLIVSFFNKPTEIAIVYYRAGYTPDDYKDPCAWEAREKVEASMAIKCPTLAQQLAGTKKMQQVWTTKGVLENLVPNSAEFLKSCFMEIYPLDLTAEGQKGYELAMAHGAEYVLKPQREGGGNNIYAEDIPEFLSSISKKEMQGYILMKRIRPPRINGILLRNNERISAPIVSELGIFGTWVADGDKIMVNQVAGHLYRTKLEVSNEGGVASGFAVLDSPYLV